MRTIALLTLALMGCTETSKSRCGEGMGLTLDDRCIPLDGAESDPALGSVRIYPTDVRTLDTVFSEVILGDEAVDTGLSIADYPVEYSWFVDGVQVKSRANHLSGVRYFDKNQDISLVVSPLSGGGASLVSDPLTIKNTAPAKPVITISPAAPLAQRHDLSCEVAPTFDLDGDRLSYRTQWSKDGVLWSQPPPPPDDGGGPSSTDTSRRIDTATPAPEPGVVPGSETLGGQVWTCSVSAYDGEVFGAQATASVTISRGFDGWDTEVVDLADADYILLGDQLGDFTGASLSHVGDVDGDGRGDFLVPAYSSDLGDVGAGRIYLVRAQDLDAPGEVELSSMPYQWVGTGPTEEAGHSVGPAGDVDGDGLSDMLICGYRRDDPYTDVGHVYLLRASGLGSPGVRSLDSSELSFVGEATEDRLGHAVGGVGDVDGDGVPDLLMGAYGNDQAGFDAGKTYLISGSSIEGLTGQRDVAADATMFLGEAPDDASGHALRGAGDVDGDGLDDFVIGARKNDQGSSDGGKVYLLLGSSLGSPGESSSLSDADYGLYGEIEDGWVGYQASGAGDVDGDGRADILIGAHMSDDGAGRVYLYFGGGLVPGDLSTEMADIKFTGQYPADQAGRSIAPAGDVDGDGLDDILIGARNHWDGYGTAYLVLGASMSPGRHSVEDSDYAFDGEESGDEAGYTVSTAGDVNADGLDDILVGAWQGDHESLDSLEGKAYLLLAPADR